MGRQKKFIPHLSNCLSPQKKLHKFAAKIGALALLGRGGKQFK